MPREKQKFLPCDTPVPEVKVVELTKEEDTDELPCKEGEIPSSVSEAFRRARRAQQQRERRAKMTPEQRGVMTPEERARYNQVRKERRAKMTPEEKARIAQALRERRAKMTPEEKERIKAQAKLRYQRRRAAYNGVMTEGFDMDDSDLSSGSEVGEEEEMLPREGEEVDEDWKISRITLRNVEIANKASRRQRRSRLDSTAEEREKYNRQQRTAALLQRDPRIVLRTRMAQRKRRKEQRDKMTDEMRAEIYRQKAEKIKKNREQRVSKVNLLRQGRHHHLLTDLIKGRSILKNVEETTQAREEQSLLNDEEGSAASYLYRMGRDRLLHNRSRIIMRALYGEEENKYAERIRRRKCPKKEALESLEEEEDRRFADFFLYGIYLEFYDQRRRMIDQYLELEYADKVPSPESPPWFTEAEGVGGWVVNYDLAVNPADPDLSHVNDGYVIPTEDPFAELDETKVQRSSTLDPKGSANDCSSRTGGKPRKGKRKQNSLDSDGEEDDSLDAVNEAFDAIQKQADKRSRNNESTDDIQDWIARAIAEEVESQEQNPELAQLATTMRLETLEKVRDIVRNAQLKDEQPVTGVTSATSLVLYYRQLAIRGVQNEKLQKLRDVYHIAREKWMQKRINDKGLLEKMDEDRKQLKENFQSQAREKIKKFSEFVIARRKFLSLETLEYRNRRLEKELEENINQVLEQLDKEEEARKEGRLKNGARKFKPREIDPEIKRTRYNKNATSRVKMEHREYELFRSLTEAIGFTPSVCKKDEKGMKCDSYIPPPPEADEPAISIDEVENIFKDPENQSVIDFWASYVAHGKNIEVALYRKMLGCVLLNRRRKTEDGFEFIGMPDETESIEDVKKLRMFIRLHGEQILTFLSRKRWYQHNFSTTYSKDKYRSRSEEGRQKMNAYFRRRYNLKKRGIDIGDGYYDRKTGGIVTESQTKKMLRNPSNDATAVVIPPKKTSGRGRGTGTETRRSQRSRRSSPVVCKAVAPDPKEPDAEPIDTSATQANCNFRPNDTRGYEFGNGNTQIAYSNFDEGWTPMGNFNNYQPTLGPIMPPNPYPNAEYSIHRTINIVSSTPTVQQSQPFQHFEPSGSILQMPTLRLVDPYANTIGNDCRSLENPSFNQNLTQIPSHIAPVHATFSSSFVSAHPMPVENLNTPPPVSPVSPSCSDGFEDDMRNDPDWEVEVPEMPKKRGRGRPRKLHSEMKSPVTPNRRGSRQIAKKRITDGRKDVDEEMERSCVTESAHTVTPTPALSSQDQPNPEMESPLEKQPEPPDSLALQTPSKVVEVDEHQKNHEVVENTTDPQRSHQTEASSEFDHQHPQVQPMPFYKRGEDAVNLSMRRIRSRIEDFFRLRYDQRILRCPYRVTAQAKRPTKCSRKVYSTYVLLKHIREIHRKDNDCWIMGVNTLKQLPGKTDFYCQQCDDRFDSYFSLLEHHTQTHEKFRYCCIHCGLYLRKGDFWMDHMQLFHHEKGIINPLPCPTPMEVDVVDMFRCTECNSEFSSLSFLDEHMSQRHVLPVEGLHRSWFRCRECFKRFDSEDDRNNHLLECVSGNEMSFFCHWCKNGKLENVEALEKHIAVFHPKEPSIPKEERKENDFLEAYINEQYKCELCPMSYVSLGFMRLHMFREHELFKYLAVLKEKGTNLKTVFPGGELRNSKCKACKVQRIQSEEKGYEIQAAEVETVSCPVCHEEGLDLHSIHKDYDRLMKTRYCVACDRFVYFNFLAQHYESIHGIPKNEFHPSRIGHQTKPSDIVTGNSEIHSCKCSLFFTSDEIHKIHTLVERDPGATCKICSIKFSTVEKLRRHRQLVHKPPEEKEKKKKTVKGPTSDRELTSEDMDKLIISTTISESITCFTCRPCRKNFKTEEFLRTHITENHKDDAFNRIFCNQCDASFAGSDGLSRHIRVHHSSKPERFICYLCGDDFQKRWSVIKDHVRNVHPGSGPFNKAKVKIAAVDEIYEEGSRFPCTVCSIVFRKEDRLKHHVGTTQHYSKEDLIRLAWCDICGLGVTHLPRHIIARHNQVEIEKRKTSSGAWRQAGVFYVTVGLTDIVDMIQEYSEAAKVNPIELFREGRRRRGKDEEDDECGSSSDYVVESDEDMKSGSSYGDETDSDNARIADKAKLNSRIKKSNNKVNTKKRKIALPEDFSDKDMDDGKSMNQRKRSSAKINQKSKTSQKKRQTVTSDEDETGNEDNDPSPSHPFRKRRRSKSKARKPPLHSSDASSHEEEDAEDSNYIPRPTRSRRGKGNGGTKSRPLPSLPPPPENPKPTIVLTKEVVIRLKHCDDLVNQFKNKTDNNKPQEEEEVEPIIIKEEEEVIHDFGF